MGVSVTYVRIQGQGKPRSSEILFVLPDLYWAIQATTKNVLYVLMGHNNEIYFIGGRKFFLLCAVTTALILLCAVCV